MKVIYSLIIGVAFLCVASSSANQAKNPECLPPLTSQTLQFLCQHNHHRSGTIISKKWKGEQVKFEDEFAYIGDSKHKVRVIQCIPKDGVFEKQVRGQQFFTYRPKNFSEDFICKYIELK